MRLAFWTIAPSKGSPHAHLSSEAADYLREVLGRRAKIRESKLIRRSNTSEPEPDIAIVQPLGEIYLEHHPYPENMFWLIEFSNFNLENDREVKSKIYASAGMPKYWIVNLTAVLK